MLKHSLTLLFAGAALGAAAAQIEFDFSLDEVGKPPPNFVSLISGGGDLAQWKIVNEKVPPLLAPLEPNAPSHNTERSVLTVQSFDMGDKQCPLLLFTNELFSDFTLATRFKITEGVVEPAAGLVFRAQNPNNYYVLRASAEGNLLWYKVVNGQSYETQGVGVRLPMEKNVWRELRVDCSGSRIRCYLDGKLAIPPARPGSPTNDLAINDTTFSHGKVGFWTKGDTKCFFVDAHVQYSPHVPYLQVVINNVIKDHPKLLGLTVYAVKNAGPPVVIGDMHDRDFGAPGTKTEADVIDRGSIYFLKANGTVEVTMPLRDRNGEVSAALKIKMKAFKGETEATAVTRATIVKKEVEQQIQAMQDING